MIIHSDSNHMQGPGDRIINEEIKRNGTNPILHNRVILKGANSICLNLSYIASSDSLETGPE